MARHDSKGLGDREGASCFAEVTRLGRGALSPSDHFIGCGERMGKQKEYVRSKGLDNRICKELILELLRSRPSSRLEVLNAIDHALPGALSAKQKGERVSYLLQSLRKQGKIYSEGATSAAKWHLQE